MDSLSWVSIAGKVWNLKGKRPDWKTCSNVYERLTAKKKPVDYKYGNCGRHKKLKPEDEAWLLRKLLELRKKGPCTSTTLQRELAKRRAVTVEASLVRRVLTRNGYKWKKKTRKMQFSKELKAERKQWADEVLEMSDAQLRAKLNFAMDGVVLIVPPKNPTARLNHCRSMETHCWRKDEEALSDDVLCDNRYAKQAKPSMCVPLWGGCSASGFATVCWHANRKLTAEEWADVGNKGKLKEAVESVNPGRRGPWTVLCDNEGRLRLKVKW